MKNLYIEFTSWKEGVSWRSKILSKTIEHAYYDDSGISLQPDVLHPKN
jgi:hypothetical protein